MSFSSIDFVIFLLVSAAILSLTRVLWLRMSLILLFNLILLGSFADGPWSMLPLAVFIALGYLMQRLVLRDERYLYPALSLLILVFLLLKEYTIAPDIEFLSFAYSTVGMSYILFRSLQVVYDSTAGQIKALSLPEYVVYTTYFPALISGPIQRFQEFRSELHAFRETPDRDRYNENILRIFSGFFKIIFVSTILNKGRLVLMNYGFVEPPGMFESVLLYTGCSLAYLFYLYYNFAGYMDVVIGWSELCGIKLPENFNQPFAAKNFLDLWSRWHITLSQWFKTYLFNPLLKALLTNKRLAHINPNTLATCAFCFTFFIMGIWHGTTTLFVVYGLFLGTGVSLNKIYQNVMANNLGKKRYQQLCENTFYSYLCRGLAIAYFAVSLICLWWSKGAAFLSGNTHILVLLMLGYICQATLLAGFYFIHDKVVIKVRSIIPFEHLKKRFILNELGLAFTLFALVAVTFVVSKNVPDFIYKAF